MQDLYRKLELNSSCSVTDIQTALVAMRDRLSPDDIADIEHVLLDQKRRQMYDNVQKTARCIVALRDQLTIPEASGLQRASISDFAAPRNHNGASRWSDALEWLPKTDEGMGWLAFFVLVSLMIVTSLVYSTFFGSSETAINETRNRKPEVPKQDIFPKEGPATPNRRKVEQAEPNSELKQLSMPATGIMQIYDSSFAVAPLEIRTQFGNGNYFVKISRISGDRLVLSRTAFIRDGGTLDVLLPIGDYEVRYANGLKWYGTSLLFGTDTLYAKADDVFRFRETSDGYSGYTIELYKQVNGNLRTDRLRADEF